MAGPKPKPKASTRALAPRASRGARRGGRGGAGKSGERRSHGPHLPNKLRRELESLAPPRDRGSDDDDEDGDDVVVEDVYEYEEGVPEEEARKNDRYDAVAKYEYEFDSDGSNADENVPSDEGEDMEEDDDGDGDEEKQIRILQETTGMPREAFDGGKKKKKKKQTQELPLQPGGGPVTIHDLMENITDKPGYSKMRKRIQQQEKKPMVVQPPLPKVKRELLDRSAAYNVSRHDISKWEGLVKSNREAPTLYFENDMELGQNTVGAIASKFEPRSTFEKQMAEVLRSTEIMEAHKNDGAKILELNKVDVEDVRERQNRLAKMRSLLFRHEMKAKRVKKIKSRTYHRLLKKDKRKASSEDLEADPEAAKESAMKLEFKRAEERMTLKHKNNSKWAKRILKRGLSVQDEGTRDAITAQLQQHALLTRKMNSVKNDSSSSDESSDDDDDDDDGSNLEAKLLNRGKEKILKVVEEDNEIPKSGVFSLPFMERAMKKRADATYEETRLDYEELEESLRKLEDENTVENVESIKVTGKRTFGPVKRANEEANKRPKLGDADENSDRGYDSDCGQHFDCSEENKKADYANNKADDVQLGTALLDDEQQNDLVISFDDARKRTGTKTEIEVGILADNSWKKVKSSKVNADHNMKESRNKSKVQIPSAVDPNPKLHNSDSDSEEEMVDGFLTIPDRKENYELPSQADLIRQAFAGDDVEAEFENDKLETLNEENPEPEEPALVPGWGQWTDVQQKKGLPSWMVKEHEDAKRKREEALKRRKDAKLKHVIISEHVDKKAEKLLATNLPFPYTSNDVYENSIRMPLGPDFNPAISVSALNRPAIVKKPGIVIKPIQYEEINPHEKPDEPKRVIQRANPNPHLKKTSAKQAKRTTSQRKN